MEISLDPDCWNIIRYFPHSVYLLIWWIKSDTWLNVFRNSHGCLTLNTWGYCPGPEVLVRILVKFTSSQSQYSNTYMDIIFLQRSVHLCEFLTSDYPDLKWQQIYKVTRRTNSTRDKAGNIRWPGHGPPGFVQPGGMCPNTLRRPITKYITIQQYIPFVSSL